MTKFGEERIVITEDEWRKAQSEYADIVQVFVDLHSGLFRLEYGEYLQLPFLFVKGYSIYRKFIAEQEKEKDNG